MTAVGAVETAARPPRHLYVHVPFCRRKCDYCAFYSLEAVPDDDRLDRFVERVLAEWEVERATLGVGSLHSVYVGGGTPSLLGVERLERLLDALAPLLTPRAEVTAETNPEDVDEGYAEWAARRGVRVSLGAQSFLEPVREALGRTARADPAQAFRALREAGCRNVGVDLIFAAPGQTPADLEDDLRMVASLGPDHVSWYELEVVAGTPLGRRTAAASADSGRCTSGMQASAAREAPGDDGPAFDSDARAGMYRTVVRGLERLGYIWYEVSNFSRPRRRCRHNVAVWRGEDYLGLGPAAVSTLGGVRRQNAGDVDVYLAPGKAGLPRRDEERLDESTRLRERLYLAARTGAPVPLAEVGSVLDPRAVETLAAAGFVTERGGTLEVTRKGRFVADAVCVRLFRAFC